MKIVLNTQDVNLINFFVKISKSSKNFPKGYEDKIEIYASRVESGLFEYISDPTIDAYLISASSSYSQKAVNLIKRKSPYVPVILFGSIKSLTGVVGADIYLPYYGEENNIINFFNLVIWNAGKYLKNFATLRKLTIKMKDVIEFGQYKYDPTRRIFSFKNKEIIETYSYSSFGEKKQNYFSKNPWQFSSKRFDEETIRRLLEIRWWDWPVEKIIENLDIICSNDVSRLLQL